MEQVEQEALDVVTTSVDGRHHARRRGHRELEPAPWLDGAGHRVLDLARDGRTALLQSSTVNRPLQKLV
ncbi:hypothetical protein [Kineococcus gypseus]|uniref:hypothetical protein n=1 Tax=Kineococcus gypseus TaxID=1637102 RepID=UPI003D7E707C